MKKVDVTEEERNSPYYKYFLRDLTPIPEDKRKALADNRLDSVSALRFEDRNRMFEPDYQNMEIGWTVLEDDTVVVQNTTDMPGVTADMFDWWFAWHGMEPIRYKIWDSEDHYYCRTRNPEISGNKALSMKERYWNTVHDVVEDASGSDLLGGKPMKSNVVISFRNPLDLGFDAEKLKDFKGTIVCSADDKSPVVMCHFFRETLQGGELLTHFWVGYSYVGGKIVKTGLPQQILPQMEAAARGLFAHNIKEFTHLAAILPEVYREFKDR